MTNMKVTTNHVPRDFIDAYKLTNKERLEFDYLNWEAIDDSTDSATFIRYKKELYDLSTFERLPTEDEWDGILRFSWSCGLVIRLSNDGETAVIGFYIA